MPRSKSGRRRPSGPGPWRPDAVARALHYGRFATALGHISFDDKGDLEGADWQWQVWHEGSYGPLQAALAMR